MPRSDTPDDPAAAALPHLPDESTVIGYVLRRAQLQVFQDFNTVFARLRLRPAEFSVLASIGRTPGQKQSAIAEALGIKRANFVALMHGLEKRGLAERRKVPGDRRSHALYLTSEGQAFIDKMMAAWDIHEQRLVDRLGGPQERDRLIELLQRLTPGS